MIFFVECIKNLIIRMAGYTPNTLIEISFLVNASESATNGLSFVYIYFIKCKVVIKKAPHSPSSIANLTSAFIVSISALALDKTVLNGIVAIVRLSGISLHHLASHIAVGVTF